MGEGSGCKGKRQIQQHRNYRKTSSELVGKLMEKLRNCGLFFNTEDTGFLLFQGLSYELHRVNFASQNCWIAKGTSIKEIKICVSVFKIFNSTQQNFF